jgi:hypothetical protein
MRWPDEWREPARLDLLRGTPVNCIVVDWKAADAEAMQPLVKRCRGMNIHVAGIAAGTPNPGAAQAAGLSAVLTGGNAIALTGLPLIPLAPLSEIPWRSPSPVVAISGGPWPRVKMGASGQAEAGPTGAPWIDSNGWAVRLARVESAGKTVWVVVEPPSGQASPAAGEYGVAVADAAACGGRWLVALDAALQHGLASGNANSFGTWRALVRTLAFFEKRRVWNAYRPEARLAILSRFSGPAEFLSTEFLNLAARRHLQYRILAKSPPEPAQLSGLQAIVYADPEPPAAALAKTLSEFVAGGGLLLFAGEAGPEFAGPHPAGESHRRYELRQVGKGRVAVPREPQSDPYALAADAHLLLSRRYDVVRLYNAFTVLPQVSAAPGGKVLLIQMVNFSARPPAAPMTLTIPMQVRSARLWMPGASGSKSLKAVSAGNGSELRLPPFPVYAAVEVERK